MLYFPKNKFVWNKFFYWSQHFFFQEKADVVHCKDFIRVHSSHKTESIGKKFLFLFPGRAIRKGTRDCICSSISHTISSTGAAADGYNEHQAPGPANPQTKSTAHVAVFTVLSPWDRASPEAARVGGGYSNRWGAEKHRNGSSSNLLQKYTRTKGCVEAQTEISR